MKSLLGALLIPVLLAALVLGAVLIGLNTAEGKASTEAVYATAEAELQARLTPLSDESVIAVRGMDDIKDVAIAGFDSNVKIAQSADVSQTLMAQALVCNSWAWPAGLAALGFVVWTLNNARKKKGKAG